MKWQVRYALKNLNEEIGRIKAECIGDEIIRLSTANQPEVVAVISEAMTITKDLAQGYIVENQEIDFICGYRTQCVWEGDAIRLLQSKGIGWGNFGTLSAAVLGGNANIAEHKVFAFANRLIHQYGIVENVIREYDRIYQVRLKSGRDIRIGMVVDYEPTADSVRSLWERFGPMDIMWNINPNGRPTESATSVGRELGCVVITTESLKSYLHSL